jgi:uncharacterized protein YecT (DUF1311 family)
MKTAIAIAMVAAAGAHAAPPAERYYTAAYNTCMNADGVQGSTPGMSICMNAEFDRQDAALNATYRDVMARLPAARQASLRTSQRYWAKHRDPGCEAKFESEKGYTMWGTEVGECRIDETIGRRLWLKQVR